MNQQLVISKEIIHYLSNKLPVYRRNDAIDMLEYIEQNFIVSDKKMIYFNSLLDQIEEIENYEIRESLRNIISFWILEKKYFIDIKLENSDDEILLATKTEDKIYMQPFLNLKEVKKYNIKFSEVETHNSQSFINPLPSHRLKHLPTIISLEKDFYYDLTKIFGPFIRNSKNIRIEDHYLPNPLASQNVLKLIRNFPNVNFDLVFLTKLLFSEHKSVRENGKKSEQYDSFIDSLSKMSSEGYKINYDNCFKSKKHRERFIFTEEFQIYIPGGFDFLNNDGYIVDNDLDISDKREIRIEKRKFELILTS